MIVRILASYVLVLSIAMAVSGEEPKATGAMDGVWLPAEAELAGQKFPEQVRKTIKLEINGDKYTVTAGKSVDQGTVKLDPAATPKTLDITGTDGPNKGTTILAIYELEGDQLRVCYDLSGKGRPTEFKTTAEATHFLVTYQRAKP